MHVLFDERFNMKNRIKVNILILKMTVLKCEIIIPWMMRIFSEEET